jgi:hypothetical protein
MHRLKCFIESEGGHWEREVTFPCFPYPGLFVGWHEVEEVFVCQGDLDGKGDIEVKFKKAPKDTANILKSQGWIWE